MYFIPEGEPDQVDQRIIHQYCTDAMHIVGIIPIKKATFRERRLGAGQADMSLESLLELYFETKPDLKGRKKELIEKTMVLDHEIIEEKEIKIGIHKSFAFFLIQLQIALI